MFLSVQWKIPSIGLDNGSVSNKQQAIIRTNTDLIHWCIYAALGGDELTPPTAAYMRQWTASSLVQVMARCLFSTKPLREPMLAYCPLDPYLNIFQLNYKWNSTFSCKKMQIKRLSMSMSFCPWGIWVDKIIHLVPQECINHCLACVRKQITMLTNNNCYFLWYVNIFMDMISKQVPLYQLSKFIPKPGCSALIYIIWHVHKQSLS